ncbi:MAG: HEAT repeat domain-containing protein [Bryobacterales bacterium]|nr:HEAT repeat domain-containing protein [Bryobacterales bacterium]
MTCDLARQSFSLYLYGELDFQQEQELEQHLDGCAVCRVSLEDERNLHGALDAVACQPSAELLQASRRELRLTVGQLASRRRGRWDWLHAWFNQVSFWRPLGAVALVAVGFFGARVWDAVSGTPPAVLRVRNLQSSPQGHVQLVLEEVRQKTVHGDLDNDQIRAMLLAAASDPSDPALRARTLDFLKAQSEHSDVRQTLLQALRRDPNPGVRLKALEALTPFAADPETRRALTEVLLSDENPGVRTMSVDLLTGEMDTETIGVLQELIVRESNPYIRQKSLKALREVNASIETF